ncbi:MAG: hypothetical protein RL088_11 [Verrucomicrobiota bacterium]|jgi:ABC-type Fe3+ transport system permease subunit
MSIAEATAISAVRAMCMSAIVCFASMRVTRRSLPSQAVWLLLAAFMMPPILTGYHVATTRADAIGWRAELEYSVLLFLRVLPLALLLASLHPRPGVGEGAYAFATMRRISWRERIAWSVRGWWGDCGGVYCAVFLVAFQEFDLAACMNARTWTVALFDAQAGGLALSDSLRLMLAPLVVEVAAMAMLFVRWRCVRGRPMTDARPNAGMMPAALFCIAICCTSFLAPLLAVREGWNGLSAMREFTLAREVFNSFLLAVVSSGIAWLLAGWAARHRLRAALLAVPGLLGALVLSLVVLAVFNASPFQILRASPIPVLSAMVLGLMPAALFVRYIIRLNAATEAAFAAESMGERSINWVLRSRPALLGGVLLFVQAYGDFTANSLLAPPALTSAFSRIFNLMHYGRTEILSALLVVTLIVPVVAVSVLLFIARFHVSRER